MCGAEGMYLTTVNKARFKHYRNISSVNFIAASHWDGFAKDGHKGGYLTQNYLNDIDLEKNCDKLKSITINKTEYSLELVNDNFRNNYL